MNRQVSESSRFVRGSESRLTERTSPDLAAMVMALAQTSA